jgi:hypothetical protein
MVNEEVKMEMVKKLYEVSQPRVRHVVYGRKIWATSPEEAMAIAARGTAWPETYDERTTKFEEGVYSAEEITDPVTLEAWTDHKDDVDYDETDEEYHERTGEPRGAGADWAGRKYPEDFGAE